MRRIVIFTLLSLIVVTGCNETGNSETFYKGALIEIMMGYTESAIELSELQEFKDVYALGAVEGLKGEIQVFNGEPFISYVKNDRIAISNELKGGASLLVYANVVEWKSYTMEAANSIAEMENFILTIAKKEGIDVSKPFPFMLEGEADKLSWHVIDWDSADDDHSHEKHINSGLHGEMKNSAVDIIGFYSENHAGVFTHHGRDSHLHFKTIDNTLAGHVDALSFEKGMMLKLPAKGK